MMTNQEIRRLIEHSKELMDIVEDNITDDWLKQKTGDIVKSLQWLKDMSHRIMQ